MIARRSVLAGLGAVGLSRSALAQSLSDGTNGSLTTGGPSPPRPTDGIPAGTALRAIDGGRTFFADHNFTHATAYPPNLRGGWDNPAFFPMGSYQDDVSQFMPGRRMLSWNTTFFPNSGSGLDARVNQVSVVMGSPHGAVGGWSNEGAEVVGFNTVDEPGAWSQVTRPASQAANAVQANRFWWINIDWNALMYPSAWPGGKYAGIFNTRISTPDGSTVKMMVASNDLYFVNGGSSAPGGTQVYQIALLYGGPVGNAWVTEDQARRGFLYGDYIDAQRAAIGKNSDGSCSIPIWALIETGGAYDYNRTWASYIQPAEFDQACWASILHGARGIIYFDHTFGGPGINYNSLTSSVRRGSGYDSAANYPNTANRNPKGVSMVAQATQTCALIKTLAPIINSPVLEGYVTSNPGTTMPAGEVVPTTTDVRTKVFGTGVDVCAKWVTNGGGGKGNGIYLIAMPRASSTVTNLATTFTVVKTGAANVGIIYASGGASDVSSGDLAVTGGTSINYTFPTGLSVLILGPLPAGSEAFGTPTGPKARRKQ